MIKPVKVIYGGKSHKGYLVRDGSMDGGYIKIPVLHKTIELYPPEKFDSVFKNQSTVYILNRR